MVPHKHVCFINCPSTKAFPFSGQTPLGHIFQLSENFNSSLDSISCKEGEGMWTEHQIAKCRNGFKWKLKFISQGEGFQYQDYVKGRK